MPEAISDASPLIQLGKVDQLSLLARLHPRVLIPSAVHDEVVLAGGSRPGAAAVAQAEAEGWLIPTATPQDRVLDLLKDQLGEGESETIRLALEKPGSLVLLDDMAARSIASRMGLRVTGTLGLLLRSKQVEHVAR